MTELHHTGDDGLFVKVNVGIISCLAYIPFQASGFVTLVTFGARLLSFDLRPVLFFYSLS
jgi:hypothetical protein